MQKILSIIMTVMFAVTMQAQRNTPVKTQGKNEVRVTLQPKIGLNFATLTKSDAHTKVGVVIGMDAEVMLSKKWGISVGALYSIQGATGDAFNLGSRSDASITLNYLAFPVTANYYFYKEYSFKIGLQPAVNVVSRVTADNYRNYETFNIRRLGVGVNEYDWAMPIGFAYEKKGFVIDAHYNIPLKRAARDYNNKNSVFQFIIGYKFDI